MLDRRLARTSRELFLSAIAGGVGGMPHLPTWVIDRLTALFEEEEVEVGRRVFAAGEPVELIYFMREGRVKLSRDGAPPWILEGRWVHGPGDAMLERPYRRTAVALTNLRLLRIPAEDWLELVEDSFDLTRGAIAGAVRGAAALEARLWATEEDPRGRVVVAPPAPHEAQAFSFLDRLALFARGGMFRAAGVQVLIDVVGLVEERRFETGEPLWTPAAPPIESLVILEGEVIGECARPGQSPLRVRFGPGSIVGGVAALGEPIRAWDARALTPVRVLAFRHEDWLDLMEDHFDLVRSVLGQIALLREETLEKLAEGKEELVLA